MNLVGSRWLGCGVCGLLLALAPSACGDGGGVPPDAAPAPADARLVGFDQPDVQCPGGPDCAGRGDGVLHVGAGKRVFTPVIAETWTDENNNLEWERDEPYVDANGNGEFDGLWLFGGKTPANGVHTDLEARALAFRQGDITVAIVYADAIGLLWADIERVRQHPALAGLAIDHVIVGATHAHSTPDPVGLWGPSEFKSGRSEAYVTTLVDACAAAVADAVAGLTPAHMQIASTLLINDPADPMSRTDQWAKDLRDPIIMDPTLTIARFVRADAPTTTIGTLINWADHPEASHYAANPVVVSAHYPHWLRQVTEDGLRAGDLFQLTRDLPGLGGVSVFVQGALGGQIGSLRGTAPLDPLGAPITELGHPLDQAVGTNAARRALEALLDEGETVTDPPLTVRSARYAARIDNIGFQAGFLIGIIAPQPLVGYDPERELDGVNVPWFPMRTTYLQVGPLALITAPGELHPELWVGGYDGSWSWGWPLLDPSKPNTPDLATAPAPPYLRDLVLANPGVTYPVLAGLAENYVGYIVPAYNYVLSPNSPYLDEADGDHYEEVYSLGPLVEAHAVAPMLDLVSRR